MHRLHFALISIVALAVAAPPAAANVPAPITKTSPLRMPALGNAVNGTLTTTVSYTDTTATAAAATGNTIALGKGLYVRLRTCVAYHLHASVPTSKCAEREVDTRNNTTVVHSHAPAVTLADQARPAAQPWGYFTAYSEVLTRTDSTWSVVAHSWPDSGLQGVAVAVAAQEQTSGTLPPNSTVTFDSPFTSAINSGQPDSICTAMPAAANGSPLPGGVSSSHPAFAGAPAYYEVGLPTGNYAGQPPLGVMLVIHGGGWTVTSVGVAQSMRADADRWRARGWETVNLSYRACGQSPADVLWFYDRARDWFGPDAKIGAIGTSAGGHLALLTAAARTGICCVVSQAGPTDLRTIQSEPAYDAGSGEHTQTVGGRWVHNLAAAAFGEENLGGYSPAAQAATLASTRVLQGFSADDAMVPYLQASDLAGAMRAASPSAYVDSVQLPVGTIAFGHGRVTRAALTDFFARERQLVAPITAATIALNRR